MKRLLLALALMTTGCFSYDPFLQQETPPTPDTPHIEGVSLVVAQGSAVAVSAYFTHEEIEGSSTFASEKIESEDPSIVTVAETDRFVESQYGYDAVSRVVLITGVRAGDAKLRITMEGGNHEGELTVRVVIP